MSTSSSTPFTRTLTSDGPATGRTFAGRRNAITPQEADGDLPLVVALHGGGYTSAYFDVPGHSLLERAAGVGIPAVALDRPGYGGSDPVGPDGSVFAANAAALDHVITELWAESGGRSRGVVVIGHSIGAAIALTIASRKPTWPLLGIAISGCLLRAPAGMGDMFASIPGETWPVPHKDKASFMFGPVGTYRAGVPRSAESAAVPVRLAELVEISSQWEKQYAHLAPRIEVPVHVRQGRFDALWVTDDEQLAEFAGALTASPAVDAEIVPGSGHAIDFHRGGLALQLQQLAFAAAASTRLVEPS